MRAEWKGATYTLGPPPVLIAFRDYHATTHANPALDRTVRNAPGLASVTPYADLPELYFARDAGPSIPTVTGTTISNTTELGAYFAGKVRGKRHEAAIRQVDLARLADVSVATIVSIEAGSLPRLPSAKR